MATTQLPAESLTADIQKAVQRAADELREREIDRAVKAYEAALRARIGEAAVSILNHFTIERAGPELIVRVKVGP